MEMDLQALQKEAMTAPILPDNDDVIGGGIVINKEPEKASKEGITITPGVTPETMDGVNDWLAEMDETLAEAREAAEEAGLDTDVIENATEASQINKEIAKVKHDVVEEDEDGEEDEDENDPEFKSKYSEAVVVIDKAGMGTVINFTEEERAKLEKAKVIKLEEVETIDLKFIKSKKKKKATVDKILNRISSSRTSPIILPASGLTAEMKGCSTYEILDLVKQSDNLLLDTQTKWSLIHNKVENTSIGKMDFDTFLKNVAATDISSFMYGIICSTYPSEDTLDLKCEKCKKEFAHSYSIKSLIRAEKMNDSLKERIATIVDGSTTALGARQVHNDAPVMQSKTFKLPVSGIVVEIGVQTAYDFINNSMKELSENKDSKYNQAAVLSSIVRTLYIPDPDEEGSYIEYDNAADVSKVIYSLKETDILVLTKQGELILDNLSFEFGLMDVNCPNCKHHIDTVPMDLESILFWKYQQASNMKID